MKQLQRDNLNTMQIIPGSREFVFLNAKAALTSSVKQIVEHAQQCLQGPDCFNDVFFKIKSVATELLSNACKHAGSETVHLSVDIDDRFVSIKKTDQGKPFTVVAHGQLRGEKKLLAYDVMHNLYAVNGIDNIIQFVVEESDTETPDINDIGEHFGLLIITKCAEEFLYHYNEHTGQNTFTVKIGVGV